MKKLFAVAFAVSIVFSLAIPSTCLGWQHVQSPGLGRFAIDPSGNLWLARANSLSKWNGSSWEIETIPNTSAYGNPSIAFSQDGRPHIVCHGMNDIWYMTKTANGWTSEYVTRNSSWAGGRSNVVIDSSGRPHVAFCQNNSHYLTLASRQGSNTWSTQIVDAAWWNTAWWPDMKMDASGNFIIAYTTGGSDDLKVAYGQPMNWTYKTLDSGGYTGYNPNLQLTANGLKRIAYGHQTLERYRIAIEQPGGTYKYVYFGNTYSWKFFFGLALTGTGEPIVTYTESASSTGDPSPLYCNWFDNTGALRSSFMVGDGSVLCNLKGQDAANPVVSSIIVGDKLFVNFEKADGTGTETWWTTVPEPSSICGLGAMLASLGCLRLRRRSAYRRD